MNPAMDQDGVVVAAVTRQFPRIWEMYNSKYVNIIGMPLYGKCPPGVLCISGTLILFIIAILIIMIFFFYYKPAAPIMIQPSAPTIINQSGGDSRFDRAPQPLRDWMGRPEFPPRGGIASIPINIPTQGLPESFQSVGIINVGDQVLPLYGRRTIGKSDRWNYYTRTDSYNPVPLPIQFQRRNCMDDVGCDELMSGQSVKLNGLHKEGKVDVYRFDGPKYIPGLI